MDSSSWPAHSKPDTPTPEKARGVVRPLRRGVFIFHLLFGVSLPLATFAIEVITGMCGELLFDPMPTWLHAVAVGLVPVANALLLHRCMRSETVNAAGRGARWLDWLSAVTLGVAGCYALLFLPLMPFAVVGVLCLGLGLLPLSPAFALISAILLRQRWRREVWAEKNVGNRPSSWAIVWGVLGMVALNAPPQLTAWAVYRLTEKDDARLALTWLRNGVSERQLLKEAHGLGGGSWFWGWAKPEVSVADYRAAFYRATGRAYNQVPPPGRGFGLRGMEGRVWDDDQGEQEVGRRLRQLELIESRLDGAVMAGAAVGYTEWTLVFRNDHEFEQREARALIQLPAGGVVSRLTLWVDGEEREAAFGGRSQVTQAYKAVVRQRRDPVLVTDKGADRVLMQCFPVPPKQGEMKVRIGVTYPLALAGENEARVTLPRLIEQNFSTRDGFGHAVWIEADSLTTEVRAPLQRDTGERGVVRGTLSTQELAGGRVGFTVERVVGDGPIWGLVPDGSNRQVRQTIETVAGAGQALAIVLDGSTGMEATGEALAAALEGLPPEMPIALWVAGDDVRRATGTTAREVAIGLQEQRFIGGQDDAEALMQAYDAVVERAGATVLWLHGLQPHTWLDAAGLEQRFARDGGRVTLCDYATGLGENARLEELVTVARVRRIDPAGEGVGEMRRVLGEVLKPRQVTLRMLEAGKMDGVTTGTWERQIGRLWAREEVDRLMAGARPRREEAVALAAGTQLVTAVTGAVVLETQAQYDEAGLKSVDPLTTPSIPEPATVALIFGVTALSVAVWRRFRMRKGEAD